MKTERKLRATAGQVSPVTRLKELALKKPAVREELWAWRKEPDLTNAAIRGRIEARFGIQLTRDGQLSDFWSWLHQVIRSENWNARVEQFEDWYRKTNPDSSVDKVRDAGIAFFLTEAAAAEDREGFVEVANLDLKKRGMQTKAAFDERKVQVQERRLALLEKKEQQADEAKAVAASNLTAEEKAARMRQIFGMA